MNNESNNCTEKAAKNTTENNMENIDENICSNILEYAKMTLDLEEKRENSLISQSSRMLTAFSISTVVLLEVYKFVEKTNLVSHMFSTVVFITCMFIFAASMVLALLVSWRWKYQSLPSPKESMNHILKNKNAFSTKPQRDISFTETIDDLWESKRKVNDKRAKLLTASMVLYFISIGIAVSSVLLVILKNIL